MFNLHNINIYKPMKLVIKIKAKEACFLTSGEGDPSRTHDISQALTFNNIKQAKRAIESAKKTHPFQDREYSIVEVD